MSEAKPKRGVVKNEAKEVSSAAGGGGESSGAQQLGSLDNLKPGQTKITPSPGNGDRVFYETLLEQNPDSEMAQDWCSTHGVLEEKEAAKLLNSKSFSCWG